MIDSYGTRRNFITRIGAAFLGLLGLKTIFSTTILAAENASVQIDISGIAELKTIGGSKLIKEVFFGESKDNLILVRRSVSEILVMSAVCRHKSCNVKFKKDKDQFVCPCHGSTYDLEGKVLKGPSKTDIQLYKAILKGDMVTITGL